MFYDYEGYQDFMAHGHTPYAKTRIGAGPNGETLVFSLTPADKKKRSGIPSIEMYDGTLAPAENFYGERSRSDGCSCSHRHRQRSERHDGRLRAERRQQERAPRATYPYLQGRHA